MRFQKKPFKLSKIIFELFPTYEEKWRFAKVLQPLLPIAGISMEFECICLDRRLSIRSIYKNL